ncbi:MAG: HAMP domain-containing sensor histidine kinase [Deltaproteobacteria bacterium]|nr:HAMP domain-containing sensor histidine kinase [Deltaproteobacteria bacterium]
MHNLARNAADAISQREGGGHFEIVVGREGEELVLQFRDDGPGIPESVRARLFESFVTQGKRDGTGLGLAIVKKVVEDHQGTVTVDTSDTGTCFTLRLPLKPSSSTRSAQGA